MLYIKTEKEGLWGKQDDIDLYNILDNLNKRNIKFALSNMLESKGRKNEYLIEWSKNIIYIIYQ